jgi:hypothetical protein
MRLHFRDVRLRIAEAEPTTPNLAAVPIELTSSPAEVLPNTTETGAVS